jgi:hypothetical protein
VTLRVSHSPGRYYVTGGDYVLNAMYVAFAVFVCAGVAERPGSSKTALALAAIFLGVAICSRPVYLMAGFAVAAYAVRRRGLRDGAGFAAVLAVTAAAISLLPAFRNMDAWGVLTVITAAPAVMLRILRGGAGYISTPYLAPLGLYGSVILAARLRDARSSADQTPVCA